MTIDDDSSIYVGGLPYDATEESLRRVFDIYGAVVAVKIINDRTVGGKCYGFVTFANPRSAMHAINEMDGRTVNGRVVRVNEVRSRGGRSNFGRESLRRHPERSMDNERGRDRERDYDQDRDRGDGHRDRSRDHDHDRNRGYDSVHDHGKTRDHFVDRDRLQDRNRDMEAADQQRERNHEYEWERDGDQDLEKQRTENHHKSRYEEKNEVSKLFGSAYDRGSREISSESADGDNDEVGRQLKISNQKLEDLQQEISRMEELVEEKQRLNSKLRQESQKLDDSLAAAKKQTSYRYMQLSKLQKSYMQVRDCNERLKTCEQELQSLVSSTRMEVE